MKLGLHQSARLEQRLIQSPQMIQAMQILQLPTVELSERIEKELTENPFLEVAETRPDADAEGGEPRAHRQKAVLDALDQMEKRAGEHGPTRRMQRPNREASDRRDAALQNAPEPEGNSLIAALHLQDLNEKDLAIGEYLVYSLDARGYLPESPESIASQLGAEVQAEDVARMIRLIQQIGPPGLGARNLQECLLLQMDRLGISRPLERALIEHHLEDIQGNRIPKIAKERGRPIPDINQAIEYIRTLNPRPGSELRNDLSVAITPDVVIEEIEGRYEVRVERGGLPELTISTTYRELLKNARKDPKVFEFLKRKIEAAKGFLEAIVQRQSTIEKICREIVRRQKDFLDRGVEALHALKMQDVADVVGVHISTVSRAISGKYVQTPQGIFDLKFFFTGGTATDSGEVESQTSIKERIVEIVSAENRRHPLSDDEIARILKDTRGVPIARRTVTKYRKTMKIPPSNLRREY